MTRWRRGWLRVSYSIFFFYCYWTSNVKWREDIKKHAGAYKLRWPSQSWGQKRKKNTHCDNDERRLWTDIECQAEPKPFASVKSSPSHSPQSRVSSVQSILHKQIRRPPLLILLPLFGENPLLPSLVFISSPFFSSSLKNLNEPSFLSWSSLAQTGIEHKSKKSSREKQHRSRSRVNSFNERKKMCQSCDSKKSQHSPDVIRKCALSCPIFFTVTLMPIAVVVLLRFNN